MTSGKLGWTIWPAFSFPHYFKNPNKKMALTNSKIQAAIGILISVISGASVCFFTADIWHNRTLKVNYIVQDGSGVERNDKLVEYFENNKNKHIHRWLHYFEAYEAHLSRFRGKEVTMVEIGVAQGGSLQMWKHFLGPKAKIVGVDIDENCKSHQESQIDIMIGDQGDRTFLRQIKEKYPKIDIVIDDGGHTMTQQITTFEELYPHVSKDGVYSCEDTQTSYWSEYGGGLNKPGTFMEMSKGLVDHLNAWFFRSEREQTRMDFTRSTHSMHFYPHMVIFEKRETSAPVEFEIGEKTIPDYPKKSS